MMILISIPKWSDFNQATMENTIGLSRISIPKWSDFNETHDSTMGKS